MAHPLQIGSWVLPTSDSLARRKKLPWDLKGDRRATNGCLSVLGISNVVSSVPPGPLCQNRGIIRFIRVPFALLKYLARYTATAIPT